MPFRNLQASQPVIAFLLRRDTAIWEFVIALISMLNGARAASPELAQTLAPFLFSVMAWLQWAGTVWITLLAVYGAVALVAVIAGLITGDRYAFRCIVTACGCFLWTLAAIAAATSGAPLVGWIGYAVFAGAEWAAALVLIVKHDFRGVNRRQM